MVTSTGEKIDIMQAYLNGQTIQYEDKSVPDVWVDYTSLTQPEWDWQAYDFRIKPETVRFELHDYWYLDTITGLKWERYPNTKTMNFVKAQSYASNLTTGSVIWRLPTIYELTAIINYSKFNPSTSLTVITPNHFWSSNLYKNQTSSVWLVNFLDGQTLLEGKLTANYACCVSTTPV